jgi:hypothetical protein
MYKPQTGLLILALIMGEPRISGKVVEKEIITILIIGMILIPGNKRTLRKYTTIIAKSKESKGGFSRV